MDSATSITETRTPATAGGPGIDRRLAERIAAREATVGVIGLGYVGLPLACTIAEAGLKVAAFDIDDAKIAALSHGDSYLRHIPPERIRAARSFATNVADLAANGTRGMLATSDFAELRHCDAIVICVPTPLTEGREPDLTAIRATAETVARHLRPGQLVVLESTTYPGTTDEIVQPILESGGLRSGEDFFLAFSPEREDPGNPRFDTRTIPKLVGGVTKRCADLAGDLYRGFIENVMVVSHARVAESAKLLENIFRAVNIALVNELKMLFHRMDIDVWEVIAAASTKPFGFMPFEPGPGLGGHCIPIDPFYLTWKAREFDFSTRFIELAGEVNTSMPYYVVERVIAALGERGIPIRDARILVLGVAYKRDIDDLRESPALKILEILSHHGARVSYNDPYVPSLETRRLRRYGQIRLASVPLDEKTLADTDCVLIATDHKVYDYEAVVRGASLVVDTRNATKGVTQQREKIVPA